MAFSTTSAQTLAKRNLSKLKPVHITAASGTVPISGIVGITGTVNINFLTQAVKVDLATADFEIGAVEIKDGARDIRATVGSATTAGAAGVQVMGLDNSGDLRAHPVLRKGTAMGNYALPFAGADQSGKLNVPTVATAGTTADLPIQVAGVDNSSNLRNIPVVKNATAMGSFALPIGGINPSGKLYIPRVGLSAISAGPGMQIMGVDESSDLRPIRTDKSGNVQVEPIPGALIAVSGDVSLESGTTVRLSAGTLVDVSGTVDLLSGTTVRLSAGTDVGVSGTVAVSGEVSLESGTTVRLSAGTDVGVSGMVGVSGTVTASGEVSLVSGTTVRLSAGTLVDVSGTVDLLSGTTVRLSAGTNVGISGTVAVSGTIATSGNVGLLSSVAQIGHLRRTTGGGTERNSISATTKKLITSGTATRDLVIQTEASFFVGLSSTMTSTTGYRMLNGDTLALNNHNNASGPVYIIAVTSGSTYSVLWLV